MKIEVVTPNQLEKEIKELEGRIMKEINEIKKAIFRFDEEIKTLNIGLWIWKNKDKEGEVL